MPVFAYKGLDARGKPVAGVRDADNPKALRTVLRRDGVFLTDAREERGGAVSGQGLRKEVRFARLFERISSAMIAALTRQLATLVRAGIPIADALAALVEQTEHGKLRGVLAAVRERVNQGSSLAEAMRAHPDAFPELYVNMVRAGETAGNLEEVLMRLADFMDSQNRLRAKVSAALLYPAIIMGVAVAIVSILMVVVVPKITAIFADLGQALPWYTQLLIWISTITGNWWWLFLLLGALAYGLFRRWRRTPAGRARWDAFVLRLILIGPIARMLAVARFARTLGTMLRAGVPLLTALDIVKHILNNQVLLAVVEEARDAIREGESIAAPLRKSGQFPPVVVHMIAVGERSGQLEGMLENVAAAYELEVDLRVQRLTTLLEPLMIVGVAVGVCFILFSILMPILEMNQAVGG